MWKAFQEMERLGWIGKERPRMVAVQAAGCAPVVKAYKANAPQCEFWEHASTLASGLRVPKPFADTLIVSILGTSGGCALAVGDDEILRAIRDAAVSDGILLCPEGAATVAALAQLVGQGEIDSKTRIVIFNTGSGLKYLEVLRALSVG
jgi:threonine synthase